MYSLVKQKDAGINIAEKIRFEKGG